MIERRYGGRRGTCLSILHSPSSDLSCSPVCSTSRCLPKWSIVPQPKRRHQSPIGKVETSQSLLAVVVGERTASRALRRDFFLEVGDLLECGHKCDRAAVRMTKMGYRFHTQESAMIPNRARVVAGTFTIGRGASR